ncbi:outer membrane protein assembly factor BamB family protein [Flindersiella endophytica]
MRRYAIRITGTLALLLSAAVAATAAPAAGAPDRPAGSESCTPGTETSYGPASAASPIVTGQVIGDTAYTVTRGLDPALIGALDLTTDRVTGTWEVPTGLGSWASAVVDGQLYAGMYQPADVYRFSPADGSITKVATAPRDQLIYDLDAGDDGLLAYGGYPAASVYTYDPASGTFRDYGRISPTDLYVRSVAVTSSTIYAGIGTHARLFAIDRASGAKQEITPPEIAGESFVYDLEATEDVIVAGTEPHGYLVVMDRHDPTSYDVVETGTDGVDAIAITSSTIYFTTRNEGTLFAYDRAAKTLSPLGIPAPGEGARELFVRGDSLVGFAGSGAVWTYSLAAGTTKLTRLAEAGHPTAPEPPQTLTVSDHAVHVAGHWSITRHDRSTGATRQFPIPGEAKSMVTVGSTVYAAIYPGASVWSYAADDPSPRLLADIGEEQNRPRDMEFNPATHQLVIGSRSNYGVPGGALTLVDVRDGSQSVFRDLVPNQAINAVATSARTPIVYVGSEIYVEGGTPIAPEARLAAFDPRTATKLWEVSPVPGAPAIWDVDLIAGRLVGVTEQGAAFSVDPATGAVLASRKLPAGMTLVVAGGKLYGASAGQLIRLDPMTLAGEVVATNLKAGWYSTPQLAADTGCGLYTLRGRDLTRFAVAR